MPEEYKSRLPELEVRPDDLIDRDQVLVSFRADYGWTDLMTLGNISTIIGKAKSRKTFFITLLLTGIVTNRNYFFKSGLGNSAVVIFDTEQGRYHVWKVAKRIENMVGKFPDNVKIYGLRPLTVQERVQEIENYLYLSEPQLVIIDGVRDLVTDINSAEQATEVVGKLMKWSYDIKCHICTVLHQNKADDNARGHIGTEIVNKSETVIQVAKPSQKERAKDYSIVSSVYTRGQEIKEFQFKIENGIPVIETDEFNNYTEPERDEETPF
jgi:RecA-family ATPase